jgi:LuxR family maltose regulon positive regulatory protein
VEEALAEAARKPLVLVTANAGYGKTEAVRAFLRGQEANAVWIQLTENDNIGSRFWENLTHIIEASEPELAGLADEMRAFGFPDTDVRFRRCAALLKKVVGTGRVSCLVLDDFHVLTNRQMIEFVERCVYALVPQLRHIILSRREPDINMVSLFSKGQVSVLSEEELRFNEEEIAEFFLWSGLPPLPARELPELRAETRGWALALRLLSLALRRMPGQRQAALQTMRRNLFKLMEREAFGDFPEGMRKLLVQLSLVSNLPMAALYEFAGEDAIAFYRSTPGAATFLWQDSFTGQLQAHPLYLDFLKTKEDLLSPEEKREVYRWAAGWCMRSHIYSNAMEFYAKLKDYPGIQSVLLPHSLHTPKDMAQFYLDILEGLDAYDPHDMTQGGVALMMLKGVFIPRLLMALGRYEEAERRIRDAIQEWERSDSPCAATLVYSSYNNLGFLNMLTCPASRQYTFARHFEQAMEHYDANHMAVARNACNSAEIDFYACLVGENASPGDLDRFLEAARAAVPRISRTADGLFSGYDDLAACEIALYRGQLDQAKHMALLAVQSARTNRQYSIEAFAQYYLMNVALAQGDYAAITGLLRRFRGWLENPEFRDRQLLYDLFTSHFYGMINLPRLAAPWLLSGTAEDTDPGAPTRETIIRAKYLIAARKYHEGLDMLARLDLEGPEKHFLFGELTRSLLAAAARNKSGDAAGAAESLERAWRLSFEGELEMMFILLGRGMHELAAAARRHDGCVIPEEWLKSIVLKASGFEKKLAGVAAAYRRDNGIEDGVRLSPRELEILGDLYRGLSRTEIAATRYLSINTVKTTLNMLYSKLGAENNVDAVRIAIEKNLVE